ncbi:MULTISPECIES: SDR family oxidoreductase [unclassified Ruegeria]|uniref:SDR family oxidoreductase n=1 Tax=unclassified Ruegeria TaxID=2625375 RepID=UPI001ADB4C1D|nr:MULTISPECIES: SDR family oxidoreductase [unclassified Ruegeria]MBO9410791.1 SDR family oxidoreductase [Ruegeria sp. R8_1]MBO9414992.1 SDR family oxidoreductase [Ruegeria sp. R8_2]
MTERRESAGYWIAGNEPEILARAAITFLKQDYPAQRGRSFHSQKWRNKMNIKNAIAFVTGANGGIGTSLVAALFERGASKVYAGVRDTDSMANLAGLYGDKLVVLALDVTDDAQVSAAAKAAQDVTLLVNNAGTTFDQGFLSTDDLKAAETEMAVNYLGPIRVTRAFAPILKANGGGAVLNILSFLSLVTMPMAGSYSASKAAALSMTRGIRAELAGQGTLVVGAMPAQVDTALAKNYPEPKATTQEVAREALDAVEQAVEDVYPGTYAKELLPSVLSDPKSIEVAMKSVLPLAA